MKRVAEIIADIMDIDPNTINEKTNLLIDLQMSSFDVVSIVSMLENEYKIDITEQDVRKVNIVDDIIKLIEEKRGQ